RYREKMRKYQDLREPSYDTSSLHESSASIGVSEYTKSRATSMENLSRVMDATNSSRASGSGNSSVSNISIEPITLANSIDNTRALLKKKSLVQIINNYIKAGIEEGKKQAKKYIRKALSFGVRSGYLIPADPKGQVIRVSPTLVESRSSDPESRKRRRRARQGNVDPSFIERKERRRLTPPLAVRRKPRRGQSSDRLVPRKRRKTSASRNPKSDLNLTNPNTKKKDAETTRRERNSAGSKKRKEPPSLPPKRKRKQPSRRNDEVVESRQDRKNRTTRSSYVDKDEKDNFAETKQNRTDDDDDSTYSDIELDQKTVTERRNSTSSVEIETQEGNENPGDPNREVEELPQLPNNDEQERNETGDVH
ncbi:hypothetical protein WN55_10450, partial [Dufourea novaeangliae]